jgi:hypothetical protein
LIELIGRHFAFALVEHLDVATQRDGGNHELGALRSCQRSSGMPKPTEKRSTLTPQRRATQKWPNS